MHGARGLTHAWITSSWSGGTGCVEARADTGAVEVRDSKNRDLPALRFMGRSWTRFLTDLSDREPDPAG